MLRGAVILFFLVAMSNLVFAQTPEQGDTVASSKYRFYRDSAFLAKRKQVNDSLAAHALFLVAMQGAKSPLLDSMLQVHRHPELTALNISKIFPKANNGNQLKQGTYLPKGEVWALGFIAILLVLFALLKYSFSRPLLAIVQAFYSNRILSNLNKEDNLFTSWPFLLLFVLFGFVVGMFFFLVTQFYQLAGGFQYFLTISMLIVVLYYAKILLLKMIGHFFGVLKAVNEYVTILYLSYFNVGLLFIPLVVAFALSPLKFGIYYITASYIILILIVGLQFARAGINIISTYRFPKLYLFLYFCALEICPILILIRAVGNY